MKKEIKKELKNLPDPGFVSRTEKILDITITKFDGSNPDDIHFVENKTGLKWRTAKDANELQSAMGRVPVLVDQIGSDAFCFIPEDYKA